MTNRRSAWGVVAVSTAVIASVPAVRGSAAAGYLAATGLPYVVFNHWTAANRVTVALCADDACTGVARRVALTTGSTTSNNVLLASGGGSLAFAVCDFGPGLLRHGRCADAECTSVSSAVMHADQFCPCCDSMGFDVVGGAPFFVHSTCVRSPPVGAAGPRTREPGRTRGHATRRATRGPMMRPAPQVG